MVPKSPLGQIGVPLMFWTKFPLSVLVLLAVMTVASPPASAEWFADLYAGAAFTQRQDVTVKSEEEELTIKVKDIKFDKSASFGGRLGYWFESAPWLGLAIDAFHFRPDVDRQDVTACALDFCLEGEIDRFDLQVTSISFDAMLRWPLLTSKQFPQGQLQPYLTVGPAILIARVKDSENFDPPKQSDTDTSVGVKVGAGIAWQFYQNVALFGEYRFTHGRAKVTFTDEGDRVDLKSDLNTHHLLAGISFRF